MRYHSWNRAEHRYVVPPSGFAVESSAPGARDRTHPFADAFPLGGAVRSSQEASLVGERWSAI